MSNGTDQPSGWAVGFTAFAGFMLIMIGAFHIFAGIAGIVNDTVFAVTEDYLIQINTTSWGWIHLIVGIIVLLAGFGVLSGATWARVTGIILAMISMLANFIYLPIQPWWSILVIAIDVLVIWALAVYSPREIEPV